MRAPIAVLTVLLALGVSVAAPAEKTCAIDLRVLDATRNWAPDGLVVRVSVGDAKSERTWSPPGTLRFPGLACRNALVEVGIPQAAPVQFRALGAAFVELPAASGQLLTLTVPALAHVAMRAADTAGHALPGLVVGFEPRGRAGATGLVAADANGALVTWLEPGQYTLHAGAPARLAGFETGGKPFAPEAPFEVFRRDISATVHAELVVAGRVVDGEGHGVDGVEVRASGPAAGWIDGTLTKRDGRFEFVVPSLPAKLSVLDETGRWSFDPPQLTVDDFGAARERNFIARSFSGPRFEVRVHAAGTAALAGADVHATFCPGEAAREQAWRARTGADGAAQLPCLDHCQALVTVRPPIGTPHFRREVRVETGDCHAALDVVLDKGASIAGRVLDAAGRAVANLPVVALDGDALTAVARAVTAPDGSFVVAPLHLGTYRLAIDPSAPAVQRRLVLASAAHGAASARCTREQPDAHLDLVAAPGAQICLAAIGKGGAPAALEGLAIFAEGAEQPVAIVRRTLPLADAPRAVTRLCSPGLPAGTYHLRADAGPSARWWPGASERSAAGAILLEAAQQVTVGPMLVEALRSAVVAPLSAPPPTANR